MNAIALFAALLLSQDTLAEPPVPAPITEEDTLRNEVWHHLFRAGAHVRYHNVKAGWFGFWDACFSWTSLFAGVCAFALPLVFYGFLKNKRYEKGLAITWSMTGLAALLISLVDFGSSSSRLHQGHAAAAAQWNSLQRDWERLYADRDSLTREELRTRYDALAKQETEIEDSEPKEDGDGGKALADAWRKEAEVRQVAIPGEKPGQGNRS